MSWRLKKKKKKNNQQRDGKRKTILRGIFLTRLQSHNIHRKTPSTRRSLAVPAGSGSSWAGAEGAQQIAGNSKVLPESSAMGSPRKQAPERCCPSISVRDGEPMDARCEKTPFPEGMDGTGGKPRWSTLAFMVSLRWKDATEDPTTAPSKERVNRRWLRTHTNRPGEISPTALRLLLGDGAQERSMHTGAGTGRWTGLLRGPEGLFSQPGDGRPRDTSVYCQQYGQVSTGEG